MTKEFSMKRPSPPKADSISAGFTTRRSPAVFDKAQWI